MIQGILEAGLRIIDKVIPDPAAKAEAGYRLAELAQRGELAELEATTRLALGQLEINKAEASNPSLFVSGWRPAVGWVCCTGLAYQFLARPLLGWVAPLWSLSAPPGLDMGDLLPLLMGLLGLGAYRTVEKVKGVARE